MKNSLESLYEQILVTEAQTKDLTNPSHNQVSTLKVNQEVFGEKPEIAKGGPDKAKVENGPSHKISTASETAPSYMKAGQFKGTSPAKAEKTKEPEETKEPEGAFTKSTEDSDEKEETEKKADENKSEKSEKSDEKKPENLKYNKQQENYTMSAFETLFKKTLIEELEPEAQEHEDISSEPAGDEDLSAEPSEDTSDEELHDEEESHEETEADLISDLRDLQTKLNSILTKLEGLESEEGEEGEEGEEEYSDEDFNEEFDNNEESEESEPVVAKESIDKPKPFSDSKGKQLLSKKNKVGKINPKGGKVHSGKFKSEPNPKAVSSKVANMTKGKPEVSSTVKKGDFIK